MAVDPLNVFVFLVCPNPFPVLGVHIIVTGWGFSLTSFLCLHTHSPVDMHITLLNSGHRKHGEGGDG